MKICFFCHIKKREILNIVDFYHQDINILKKIDPNLKIAIKYSEIDWRADVIFVWWWTYAFFPVMIARLLGKKIVITGTFNYRCPNTEIDYFRRPFWQRFLIRFSTKFASKNILVSYNEYKQIKADWEYTNLLYSPHCVDTDKYRPSFNGERKDFLFSICWTGKENVKRKCLFELIDAIVLLKKKRPDILLLIAGHKGDAFENIAAYIKNKKIDKNILLLGEITEKEKIEYLQNCACYVQPSKYEGFGLAMAEAMSCGAVVITTAVGEVPNVVGNAGILLQSFSSSDIAIAVDNFYSLSKSELGIKARERILSLFPIKRRKTEIVEIIENI